MKRFFAIFTMLSLCLTTLAQNHTVLMKTQSDQGSMAFDPPVIFIKSGDSVSFSSPNGGGHHVKSISGPQGYKPWSSEFDQDFTTTLYKPGVYFYICPPHLALGMIGFIVVDDTANFQSIQKSVQNQAKLIYANKERIKDYLDQVKSSS